MNALDRLDEKARRHGQTSLTTLEKLVLASGSSEIKFQGAVELRAELNRTANADAAETALRDILQRAKENAGAIELSELEAVLELLSRRTYGDIWDLSYTKSRQVPEWE